MRRPAESTRAAGLARGAVRATAYVRGAVRAAAYVVGLAALASCGGGPPIATAADAARANLQLADLERGRSLMISKCGSCHVAPMPAEHTPAEWPRSISEMSQRANLDAAQRHLIELYLVTMTRR